MSGTFKIERCPAEQRPNALRILHSGLPPDQQIGLVHALRSTRDQDDSAFHGLLVAFAEDAVVGACWAQLTAGRTAVAWLPDSGNPAAADLMKALAVFLDANEIALAQLLVSQDSTVDERLLAVADFQRLAKLAYLSVDCEDFPSKRSECQLVFEPQAGEDPDRLGVLLMRTYVDSHDCPKLNGVRRAADVLDGYREQGEYSPERWFTVQCDDVDVGALILTVHADTGNWELVYMGLVPEARGAALGRHILDFAMWQAAQGGAERLVLAVDEANPYALGMYERAGFVAWDYRTVYARLCPIP